SGSIHIAVPAGVRPDVEFKRTTFGQRFLFIHLEHHRPCPLRLIACEDYINTWQIRQWSVSSVENNAEAARCRTVCGSQRPRGPCTCRSGIPVEQLLIVLAYRIAGPVIKVA